MIPCICNQIDQHKLHRDKSYVNCVLVNTVTAIPARGVLKDLEMRKVYTLHCKWSSLILWYLVWFGKPLQKRLFWIAT